MILKHIYLYLNLNEYPVDVVRPFGFHTRYLCNYLERRLKAEKFHAEGFSKIAVEGKHFPDDSCLILPENAAVPGVLFEFERYDTLAQEDRHEFYISMLSDGLAKCARHHCIPLNVLMQSIDDFRQAGYKNEWIHRVKLLRGTGIRASLLCRLSPERFVLDLQLERRGAVFYRERALETKPDEIIFAHRFKDVVLNEGSVIILGMSGKPTFSVKLSEIQ
ncbi:hypothetical protein [uncultured Thiodictyon sp.]|jgi:hypothetical protein|uniref:hypothetical protein n=1 Tax=uncultured Thiodictyon sp. TaxID=1846217 RepID=UPI0025D5350E|nr:hypothetical protein [uncultured Thiodictyon sp.]